ncbi:MAG: hypothetical protein EOO77_24375 [Oxalobacteraceae bacterium]|nr:MAG: hypothetical protein EOO77_24375 [Oxalobacteraceae bacterium]
MAAIADLYRYPVKGLSPEPLTTMALSATEGLPFDRDYALALGTTAFDPGRPEPLDKGYFLMLRTHMFRETTAMNYVVHYNVETDTPLYLHGNLFWFGDTSEAVRYTNLAMAQRNVVNTRVQERALRYLIQWSTFRSCIVFRGQ